MPQGVGESFLDGLTGLTPSPERADWRCMPWVQSDGIKRHITGKLVCHNRLAKTGMENSRKGGVGKSVWLPGSLGVSPSPPGAGGSVLRVGPGSSGKNSLVSRL